MRSSGRTQNGCPCAVVLAIFGLAAVQSLPKALHVKEVPLWGWAGFVVFAIGVIAAGIWWDEQSKWPKYENVEMKPDGSKGEGPPPGA